MMIRSPEEDERRYLESLNACFGHWGEEALWAWVFERDTGQGKASRMVIAAEDEQEWIAGSGISWRELVWPDQSTMRVGIMSGSWTLPAARGKGCFSKIIEESRQWTKERGGGALLAFVTEDNASRRRLEAAGSVMLPSSYLLSSPQTQDVTSQAGEPVHVEATDDVIAKLYQQAQGHGDVVFGYASAQAWRGQFLQRPAPGRILRFDGLGHLLVEETETTIRALALLPEQEDKEVALFRAAVGYAQRREKVFFTFTSEPAKTLEKLGDLSLNVIPGYVTVLEADGTAWPAHKSMDDLAVTSIHIHNGDRM